MSWAVPLAALWATLSGCGPEEEGEHSVQAGRALAERHRYAEARRAFEEALALDSLNAAAHCALGDLDARLGHVERAARAYEAALAADSAYHRARHNLAVLEADRGRLPLAIELLEHIPTYIPALRTLPLFYAKQGRYDRAEQGLHTALAAGGESIDVRQQLGRLYLRQGRYHEARAALDQALVQDSTQAESHRLLGLLHLAERRYSAALAAFRRTLALNPHQIEAHYNLSSALLGLGQPTQAQTALARFEALAAHAAQVALLRRQLDAAPNDRETRLQLAQHYRQLGRDDDALTHYRAALLADPANLEILIPLSGLLLARGRYQEVLELCGRGIAQHPADERTSKLHFTRGYVYMQRNQYEDARTSFEHALALDSSSATAWNNLGHIQLRLGEEAAGQRALEAAIAADSTLADAHFNLGGLFLQKGQLAPAQRAYRAALAADSTLVRTYYALATVYQAQGSISEARRCYQAFIDKWQGDPDFLRQARARLAELPSP